MNAEGKDQVEFRGRGPSQNSGGLMKERRVYRKWTGRDANVLEQDEGDEEMTKTWAKEAGFGSAPQLLYGRGGCSRQYT
jgi:hypothetical protein